MIKFIAGFFSATVVFLVLLYSVKMPEYITYDCARLEAYDNVPEHVVKACLKVEERETRKWLRV